jgi:uncharacterized protein with HEPN domain
MKEKPDDYIRLLHIYDAIIEIESYITGITLEQFEADSKTRFASIKQVEIIGEASYHISKGFKQIHAEIEWEQIIGLRHILVHEYYGIENDILWRILQTHIPDLKKKIYPLIGK